MESLDGFHRDHGAVHELQNGGGYANKKLLKIKKLYEEVERRLQRRCNCRAQKT